MQAYQALTGRWAVLALWYIVNTSLIAYYKLLERFGGASQALLATRTAWQELGIHTAHLNRWQDATDVLAFIDRVQKELSINTYHLLDTSDEAYPSQLLQLYDPPPVLFYRGNVARLNDEQIAIVGTRNPTQYAQKITFDLAQYLVQSGYTITSGLAQGVDRQAHLGALTQLPTLMGRTVGVMGTGIDVCYPRNHHALFAQIIDEGGCVLTELLPATPASKHTFPRRNRLVAGLSLATVVTEAAVQSGSLITARLSAEQGKQVFVVPGLIDNPQAQGCHHLIREGATLIYHPNHILEDIGRQIDVPKTFGFGASPDETPSKPTQNSQATVASSTSSVAQHKIIPKHLTAIFDVLSDTPQDLDALVAMSGMAVPTLLAGLLELEILGVLVQIGGRYAKA